MDHPTPTPTPKRCAQCGGELIGDELAFETCGHCGGRSLRPSVPAERDRSDGERRTVATVTTKTQPTVVDLTALEAAYTEEGFDVVDLRPSPINFEDPRRGWETRIIATNNPYR